MQKLLGKNLVKLFGPQHGFVTDVQDNMIETKDYIHPYFKIPVHSLYSHTRIPTDQMLDGVDTFVVDLQDVGTRVYTYITTLALSMQACGKKGIKVVVLDRPNPVGGEITEGTILESSWKSFVGHHKIPQRHALTMGEVALLTKKFYGVECELEVVKMEGWERGMFWKDTGLPWVNPSPNLPTPEGALTFVGTVLYEGTNLSEGRGTTRSLEVVGHPKIEPFSFAENFTKKLAKSGLTGQVIRPVVFLPMFQKHSGHACGGVHLHFTDPRSFRPWTVSQLLCREFSNVLGSDFQWRDTAYEYEHDRLAIDLINGTEQVRKWVEKSGTLEELQALEARGLEGYRAQRREILLY